MSHFLFVTFFAGGNVPPELGLARRLIERGHRVTVLADDCLAAEAEAAGARFVGFHHAPNRPTKAVENYPVSDWEFRNPLEGLRQMVANVMCGPALEMARDMLDLYREDPFDAVAGCGLLLAPILGAEKLQVPCLVLMPNLEMRPVPGRPPSGPGFQPLRGPLGGLRDHALDAIARRAFNIGRPPLERARQALGLPPVGHPFDEYSRATRVLLLTSQAFDYPHRPLPDTVFAGPVLDDPSWTEDGRGILTELDTVERPIVLATLGSTFQDQGAVYHRVIEALGELDVHAIVTLGGPFDLADFAAPPNVRVVQSAPHLPILERASAALIHCGHGSVMKGLAAGVPLVCMPLGRDQLDNAARVQWHGAGISVKPKAPTSRIRAAIAQVLAEPSYAEAARTLATAIHAEVARNVAIEELESAAERQAMARRAV
jgi:UDP:flavonoid glycosyltransferase YjiC (YdhE family)